jgi:uncharacterized membrane protein YccC
MAPLILGFVLGKPEMGVLGGVGGLWTGLSDSGGTFRTKAISISVATVLIAAGSVVGTVAANSPLVAMSLMLIAAFFAGMAGVYGNAASTVGSISLVSLMIYLAAPGTLAEGFQRAAIQAAGSAWAAVLSLYLWPLRPYQPVVEAIAQAYEKSAELLEGLRRQLSPGSGAARWSTTLVSERDAAMQAIQKARDMTAEIRTRRQGATYIGQDLLVLTRYADRLLGATVALAETLELASESRFYPRLQLMFLRSIEELAQAAQRVARAARSGGGVVDLSEIGRLLREAGETISDLRDSSEDLESDFTELLTLRSEERALRTAGRYLHNAGEIVSTLGKPRRVRAHHGESGDLDPAVIGPTRLRDNLTRDSLIFRHALRLAVACATAVAVYSSFHIAHGAWVTLTVFVILKPDFGGTRQRAIQRVAGTVAGGLLGIALAYGIQHPLAILIALGVLAFAAFSQMSLEYHRFVFFLTPFVVMLLSLGHPGDWQVALVRMVNTVVGGLIALAAGYTLWPAWALESLPSQLAKATGTNREYFDKVMTRWLRRPVHDFEIRSAHEAAQVECSNVYVSFQRMLSDPSSRQAGVEPFYALASYTQRFCDDVTTLSAYLHHFSGKHGLPGLEEFAAKISQSMADLAIALESSGPPPPSPSFDDELRLMNDHVQELVSARAVQIQEQRFDTPQRQALRDFGVLTAEIGRMAEEVVGMYRALDRLRRESPWVLQGIHVHQPLAKH